MEMSATPPASRSGCSTIDSASQSRGTFGHAEPAGVQPMEGSDGAAGRGALLGTAAGPGLEGVEAEGEIGDRPVAVLLNQPALLYAVVRSGAGMRASAAGVTQIPPCEAVDTAKASGPSGVRCWIAPHGEDDPTVGGEGCGMAGSLADGTHAPPGSSPHHPFSAPSLGCTAHRWVRPGRRAPCAASE
jgi:hypothetical protein